MSPNIDAKNREIIRQLQTNARQSNRAIAEAIDMSPSSTLERVRDLEQTGVITGYHASVDPTTIGRPVAAMISVRVQPKTRSRVEGVIDRLWELDEVVAVYLVSGEDDLIVEVSVADTVSLQAVVVDEIASIPGVVDERTSMLFEHRRKRIVEPLV